MTERRRFQVVPPDWGEAHLTPEAVVAYVDDELAPGPDSRARRHLRHCACCAAEVLDQRSARTELRGANAPTLPTSLMSALQSIPQDTELPPPPAGLSMTADGELISVLRREPGHRPDRERRRRRRIGTGAAVSGLALGALAFGLPSSGLTGGAPAGPSVASPGAAIPVARFAPAARPLDHRPHPSSALTPTPTPTSTQAPAPRPTVQAPRPTMQNVNLPPAP